MNRLIGLMALLCIYVNSFGQSIKIEPYYIGDRIPDLPLKKFINYKDSSATLSSFGHKLIILDFWHTHCGACIAMFPLEDSLQKLFKDKVQFILVTAESKRDVVPFLHRWDSAHHTHLSIPVVTADVLLNRMFRHFYNPHYAWLAPDGTLIAQTLDGFITKSAIEQALINIEKEENHLRAENFPESYFTFPKLTPLQSDYLKSH